MQSMMQLFPWLNDGLNEEQDKHWTDGEDLESGNVPPIWPHVQQTPYDNLLPIEEHEMPWTDCAILLLANRWVELEML